MMRPQVAWRPMWRRANSLIIRAAAIASTVNCRVQVSAVTGCRDRPSRSTEAAAKVSASDPVALLIRMSTGPNCSSAVPNSMPGVAGSDKSASTAAAWPPLLRMRAMTASASCARWSRTACGVPGSSGSWTRKNVTKTAHPRAARTWAVAAPMP